MAGYSHRSVSDKLGLKLEQNVLVIDAPSSYEALIGTLPPGLIPKTSGDGPFDVIHYFATSREDLEQYFPDLKSRLSQGGMLWISWIKGSSQPYTDLNENIVMQIGLKNGLVDVKVIAIDEKWSGLKFVYRVRDRK
jgi:hypothetical protein